MHVPLDVLLYKLVVQLEVAPLIALDILMDGEDGLIGESDKVKFQLRQ